MFCLRFSTATHIFFHPACVCACLRARQYATSARWRSSWRRLRHPLDEIIRARGSSFSVPKARNIWRRTGRNALRRANARCGLRSVRARAKRERLSGEGRSGGKGVGRGPRLRTRPSHNNASDALLIRLTSENAAEMETGLNACALCVYVGRVADNINEITSNTKKKHPS